MDQTPAQQRANPQLLFEQTKDSMVILFMQVWLRLQQSCALPCSMLYYADETGLIQALPHAHICTHSSYYDIML